SQRDSWQVRQLLAPLQRLLDHDPQGSLAATLESWCAHDGHAQACAQALGIHRNSLRYRLERIASISGLDLARLEHRQQLLLGLQLLVPRRG
ncbi:CdaR family transcriptional regulator, partial [Pseudomonas aeruginosa]|nr:CdaR family transcriptional regulator [Pseudomonas aeruginosa]